jgi:hypothetical protein
MKPIHLLLGVLLAASTLQAQTLSQDTANPSASPGPTPYTVVAQDANSQIWQSQTYEQVSDGSIVTNLHQYTELATGLNHLVNGQWVASSEQIEISPDGSSASATNGQHQVYFPGNIYSGVIKLVTPDGQTLQSQPIGLSYFDGTNSVLIAMVTNATGAILPSGNQVIYTNAFDGLNADLLYIYTKAGFEQDVILQQQPPDPVSLGLNPQTTRLQVLTEFFNPPQPVVTATTVPTAAGNLEDDYLSFGAMGMGQGKAFLFGNNSPSVEVNKQWLVLEARQFLVEELPIVSIASEIDTLPPYVAQAGSGTKLVVSKSLMLPPQRLIHTSPKTTFLAQAVPPSRGLVLDYVTLNSSMTNYTFQGDTTYYISGPVNLYGSNSFEGGAVIKYTNNASITVNFTYGSPLYLNWLTSAYRPVFFTAKDDNSVGETLSVSTGTPTNYYANPALYISVPPGTTMPTPSYFRVSYAQQALYLEGVPTIQDGQIVNCQNGVQFGDSSMSFRNLLFANVQTNLNTTYTYYNPLNIQNCTFSSSSNLIYAQDWSGQNVVANLTNCILANVANLTNTHTYSFTYQVNGGNNGCYNSPSFGTGQVTNNFYPFQTVGAGNYYLTNGCNFFNAGTTNIDPTLLAALRQKTTYPPIVLTTNFTGNTTLGPLAQRDTDTPDLGYHYDPLDYCWSGLSAGTTLTLTNGVAIGIYGASGLSADNLVSQGTATTHNQMVYYNLVQEQPTNWGTNVFNGLFSSLSQAQIQFTDFCLAAGQTWNFCPNVTGGGGISLNECQLQTAYFSIAGLYELGMSFTNNLFDRCNLNFSDAIMTYWLSFYNNLFWGGQGVFALENSYSTDPFTLRWNLYDNLFVDVSLNAYDSTYTPNHSYNAYYETSAMAFGYANETNGLPAPTGEQTLGNIDFQPGPLGQYYYPTNGTNLAMLIHAGSTNASLLGLYHYTVTTNEVVEGTNIVSIGYHYVATDTNGNPLSTPQDGIPDYVADANGNGIVDSGEISWTNYYSVNGLTNGSGLLVFTPLK